MRHQGGGLRVKTANAGPERPVPLRPALGALRTLRSNAGQNSPGRAPVEPPSCDLVDGREPPGPSKHRGNVDDARPISVDNAKGPHDDLSDLRIRAFWHHTTRLGEGPKAFDGGDESINRELRIPLRVLGDVVANCRDISDGPRRPPDRRHWLSCRLTSSCGMPLPASISPSPASILAKKIKRSIASSKVASDGRSCRASRI
jgi:hypothetical protein